MIHTRIYNMATMSAGKAGSIGVPLVHTTDVLLRDYIVHCPLFYRRNQITETQLGRLASSQTHSTSTFIPAILCD